MTLGDHPIESIFHTCVLSYGVLELPKVGAEVLHFHMLRMEG